MSGWRKTAGSHWHNGSSTAYRTARGESLRAHLAAGGGCTLKIHPECTGKAEQWHHTRDRRLVGDDPRYLVWTCKPCNLMAGDPTKGDPTPDPGTKW